MARAQQVVRLLLIKGNRATDVGADLGVGNDAVVAPVLASCRWLQGRRIKTHEEHNSLGLLVELALVQFVQAFRNDVEG